MLEVRDLGVSYRGLRAVDAVSLEVRRSEIVSIVGMNGAGKTSILNAIAGVVPPDGGEIRFEGESIGGLPAHAVVARGIVQVPEGRLIFGTLSVEENLRLGAHHRDGFVLRRRSRPDLHRLFPALADKLDRPAASLSGGEAQLLALARGLEAGPRLLLLDEPSLGLSPKLAAGVFELIGRLRDGGLTVLLVEQNVTRTLALADRAYVLEGGRIALQGPAAELMADERLVSNYLGFAAVLPEASPGMLPGASQGRPPRARRPLQPDGGALVMTCRSVAVTVVAGLVVAGPGQSPALADERKAAEVECAPVERQALVYDCAIALTGRKSGTPIADAEFTVGADMPSMPAAHNVRPVPAEPHGAPGMYRARIELEMAGEWALRLDFTRPGRDRLVRKLRFGGADGHGRQEN